MSEHDTYFQKLTRLQDEVEDARFLWLNSRREYRLFVALIAMLWLIPGVVGIGGALLIHLSFLVALLAWILSGLLTGFFIEETDISPRKTNRLRLDVIHAERRVRDHTFTGGDA